MLIGTTREIKHQGVNFLVYGLSGAGKTYLCSTLPKPLIVSAESGLRTLQNFDIPFVEVKSFEDVVDFYTWATTSEEAKQFETICFDSISEIAEIILQNEKQSVKDARQAYITMGDKIQTLIRMFRDLPFNTYFTAKIDRVQDEMNNLYYAPSIPGSKAAQGLPYYFDEVFALQMQQDEQGNMVRYIQTQNNGRYNCKDRSGTLNFYENADLGAILNKIKGETK